MSDYRKAKGVAEAIAQRSGHELPAVETVVKRTPGYVVVEKVGRAGEVAEQTDARAREAGAG